MTSPRTEQNARRRVPLTMALVVLALTSLAPWAAPAVAVELEDNQTYAGATRVESSSVGLSFLIPEGWGGRFERDALLLRSSTIEGVALAILQAGVTAAEVMASLNKTQDPAARVVLQLTEPPATRGSLIASRYQNETYVGRALALFGPTRNAMIFFVAGPAKNESAYVRLLKGSGDQRASSRRPRPTPTCRHRSPMSLSRPRPRPTRRSRSPLSRRRLASPPRAPRRCRRTPD